jgi:hypothetical protein
MNRLVEVGVYLTYKGDSTNQSVFSGVDDTPSAPFQTYSMKRESCFKSKEVSGDTARADTLADDLAKRFPKDTVIQFNCLPTLHAQLSLNRNEAPKAIETLAAATPYELESTVPIRILSSTHLSAPQTPGGCGRYLSPPVSWP